MALATHKISWAFVVVLTFLSVLVAAPFAPALSAEAQASSSTNIAVGQPATQSSTRGGGDAGRAVDGNTDGVMVNGSVSHTDPELNTWWQVDLGASESIDSISLFNRTEAPQRLTDFYVFVSEVDFGELTFDEIVADPTVQQIQHPGTVGESVTFYESLQGRFVRVQLAGEGFVSLAEVQVFQTGAEESLTGDQWNRVGEQVNLGVTWPVDAEVVGLPAGLVWADSVVTGSVSITGRWPVEVKSAGRTEYFEWLITDGAPDGAVSEHVEVNPNEVSPRPMDGTDGVVWNQGNADTTSTLDVTVWDMQQVGDYMYVGGEFQEVIEHDTLDEYAQAYLARFAVDTGKWDPSFRPVLDGNVHALELSPRGLLLVGGEFTNINGVADTQGLAAVNPATGQVDTSFGASVDRPWYPEGRALVRELEVVGRFLYIGGNFSHVDGPGETRVRVHNATRVSADYGTIDSTWLPVLSGGSVWGIGVDQDRGRVHLNGRFSSANGSTDDKEYVAVTSETGATVEGLPGRPINQSTRSELYDVEYAGGRVWMAGSQHFLIGLDADTHALDFWNFAGNNCTTVFCWSGAGTGGDFQYAEKIGDFVYSGCHCTDLLNSSGLPNHYSSVTDERTTHSVSIAYSASTGAPVDTEFDIGGNVDGGWSVATDDVGCIWLGGDIIDGGFYEPGGRVFARGFARFCGDAPVPAAPEGLTVTTAEPGNVTLVWDQVVDAAGYRISRGGLEVGSIDSGLFTTWTDTKVVLGGGYDYEVFAENRAGAISQPQTVSAVVGFLDVDAPTVPTNVVADDVGDGTIAVSWDASTDNVEVSSYLVYRDDAYIGFAAGDVTSFIDTPPAPGVPYFYEVRAVDIHENRSDVSDPGATVVVGGTDAQPPSVPANVVATDLGDGTVEISWEASTDNVGVNSYLIYRDGAYRAWATSAVTSIVDTPVADGVEYSFTVRAVDVNDNRSDRSPAAIVTIGGDDVEAPSVPTNVVATDVGDGTVALSWDASTDNRGIASYLIYRDGAYLAWTSGAVTALVDTPPAMGVEYSYIVRAIDISDNRSDASNPGATVVVGGVDVEAPSAPANVIATDVGDGTVAVSWDASIDNVGITSYLIYRDGTYLAWTSGVTTDFVDTPPAAGVEYTYTIRAIDINDNRSDASAPGASVTIGGADVELPTEPQNVVAVDVGDGSVDVSWDASTDNVGVSSYLVYRDARYLGWSPVGVTTFSDTPPVQGVEYTYEIRSVDTSDNRSARSNPGATITVGGPDLEAPSAPGNVGVVTPVAGATELIWDPSIDNAGIASYLIYRNGAYLAWTPGDTTTFIDGTTVAGETYDYEVRAIDTNDNRSDKSAVVTVTAL